MSVDYGPAIEMFVPDAYVFADNSHSAIVLHKTAGFETAQEVAAYFQSGSDGRLASVHFIIGLDGTVIQCVRLENGAGGNCCLEHGHDTFWDQFNGDNLNIHTLSIEHVDPDLENRTTPPEAQVQASIALCRFLSAKYKIAPSHVKTHHSIAPLTRWECPGNFPVARIIQAMATNEIVPAGWRDDGTTLTAPWGNEVVKGFRQFVLSYPGGWDPGDQPLANEEAAIPVEIGWKSDNGTRQFFMYHELGWTQTKGVYLVSVGREAYAATRGKS